MEVLTSVGNVETNCDISIKSMNNAGNSELFRWNNLISLTQCLKFEVPGRVSRVVLVCHIITAKIRLLKLVRLRFKYNTSRGRNTYGSYGSGDEGRCVVD